MGSRPARVAFGGFRIRQTSEAMDGYIEPGILARDHVHMFLSIRPKPMLSDVMRRIKGGIALPPDGAP